MKAVAQRLRTSCRCHWQAEDRNRVIAWLAARVDAQPPRFPLLLVRRGTTWWLEKV
jgi:hypothetical protein